MAQLGANVSLSSTRLSAAFAALTLVLGCSGRVDMGSGHSRLGPGSVGETSGDAGTTPGTGGAGGGSGTTPGKGGGYTEILPRGITHGEALCVAEGRFDRTVLAEADFKQRIAGRWILCGATSIWGTAEDGLEITTDGAWYKLHDQAGSLVRATAAADHGTWEVLDTSETNGAGWFQLNLDSSLGTVMVHPDFTASPLKMAVSNEGVYNAVYVRSDQSIPDGSASETFSATVPPESCPASEPAAAFTMDIHEFEALITGRWLSCSGSVFDASDDVGLELTSDGAFHKLYRVAPDTVLVGHGFGREGAWTAIDTSEMNGPGTFQVDLDIAGVGGISTFPKATTSPRTLVLPNSMTTSTGHYVIAP